MDTIKGWTALIAATAIISAVFTALLPPGKTKTAFMTLVGVVIVCAVISPFASKAGTDFDFFEDVQSFGKTDGEYQKQSENAAKKVAENGYETAVRRKLEEMSVTVDSIEIVCDNDCIIQSVTVVSENSANNGRIKTTVREICGDSGKLEIINRVAESR